MSSIKPNWQRKTNSKRKIIYPWASVKLSVLKSPEPKILFFKNLYNVALGFFNGLKASANTFGLSSFTFTKTVIFRFRLEYMQEQYLKYPFGVY